MHVHSYLGLPSAYKDFSYTLAILNNYIVHTCMPQINARCVCAVFPMAKAVGGGKDGVTQPAAPFPTLTSMGDGLQLSPAAVSVMVCNAIFIVILIFHPPLCLKQ